MELFFGGRGWRRSLLRLGKLGKLELESESLIVS